MPDRDAWRARQHRLNLFVKAYLKGVGPVREDGVPGPSTTKRIKQCQWWLGWEHGDGEWSDKLASALREPRNGHITSGATVRRGMQRRLQHNLAWVRTHARTGVVTYDGVRVAAWLTPHMNWARHVGHNGQRWHGVLVSGFRDPVYSEHLCYAMCGHPSCPGRCAGRASNHSGKAKPLGAIDVNHYGEFGALMPHCPEQPRIFNALGAADPVHFSATGR